MHAGVLFGIVNVCVPDSGYKHTLPHQLARLLLP